MNWTLEICGKTVDVSKVYMNSTFKVCQESIQEICTGVYIDRK